MENLVFEIKGLEGKRIPFPVPVSKEAAYRMVEEDDINKILSILEEELRTAGYYGKRLDDVLEYVEELLFIDHLKLSLL
jgi:hypothetical protein